MKKVFISSALIIGLFCIFSSFVEAQSSPTPSATCSGDKPLNYLRKGSMVGVTHPAEADFSTYGYQARTFTDYCKDAYNLVEYACGCCRNQDSCCQSHPGLCNKVVCLTYPADCSDFSMVCSDGACVRGGSPTPTVGPTSTVRPTPTSNVGVSPSPTPTTLVSPSPTPAEVPPPPPSESNIEVIFPNGGEKLEKGSSYEIRWATGGDISRVGIALYRGQKTLGAIAKDISANQGSLIWKLDKIEKDNNYRIGVYQYPWKSGNVVDYSEKSFSVAKQGQGPVSSPSASGPTLKISPEEMVVTMQQKGRMVLLYYDPDGPGRPGSDAANQPSKQIGCEAEWSVADSTVVSVSKETTTIKMCWVFVKALKNGSTTIEAKYKGLSATLSVRVVTTDESGSCGSKGGECTDYKTCASQYDNWRYMASSFGMPSETIAQLNGCSVEKPYCCPPGGFTAAMTYGDMSCEGTTKNMGGVELNFYCTEGPHDLCEKHGDHTMGHSGCADRANWCCFHDPRDVQYTRCGANIEGHAATTYCAVSCKQGDLVLSPSQDRWGENWGCPQGQSCCQGWGRQQLFQSHGG